MESDPFLRARRFRDVLYESLAGAEPAARDAAPLQVLSRLIETVRSSAVAQPSAAEAIAALAGVAAASQLEAAVALAADRFETPERFRDAVYFARAGGHVRLRSEEEGA
jgi:hypothetical protein